jgi:hypothetical protein
MNAPRLRALDNAIGIGAVLAAGSVFVAAIAVGLAVLLVGFT